MALVARISNPNAAQACLSSISLASVRKATSTFPIKSIARQTLSRFYCLPFWTLHAAMPTLVNDFGLGASCFSDSGGVPGGGSGGGSGEGQACIQHYTVAAVLLVREWIAHIPKRCLWRKVLGGASCLLSLGVL